MSGRGHFLDEISRLMTDAASAAQGIGREAQVMARTQIDRAIADMNLVRREEFEAVRDMAVRARRENDALSSRLAALEARLTPAGTREASPAAAAGGKAAKDAASSKAAKPAAAKPAAAKPAAGKGSATSSSSGKARRTPAGKGGKTGAASSSAAR